MTLMLAGGRPEGRVSRRLSWKIITKYKSDLIEGIFVKPNHKIMILINRRERDKWGDFLYTLGNDSQILYITYVLSSPTNEIIFSYLIVTGFSVNQI